MRNRFSHRDYVRQEILRENVPSTTCSKFQNVFRARPQHLTSKYLIEPSKKQNGCGYRKPQQKMSIELTKWPTMKLKKNRRFFWLIAREMSGRVGQKRTFWWKIKLNSRVN